MIVKTLLVPVPKVSTGLALDKVKGLLLDKTNAALELAPLWVTELKVSASVPVMVIVFVPVSLLIEFIPPAAILIAPYIEFTAVTMLLLAVVKHVPHEITPLVALRSIGVVAETAIVPFVLGTVSVVVVPVKRPETLKANFLVVSLTFWIKVVSSLRLLCVNVWLKSAKTKASFAVIAGIVSVLAPVGEVVMVVIFPPVPNAI